MTGFGGAGQRQADQIVQPCHFARVHLIELTLLGSAGNENRPVAYPLQTADPDPLRLLEFTHLTVAPFHNHYVIPAVTALTREELDVGKATHLPLDLNAFQ